MPLPNDDPSNPGLPAPLFADVDAVRGDQLRALCQLVWENFQYLFDFTGRDTDTLSEGDANLYFTTARVLATLLAGYSTGGNTALASTDSVLAALGKIQGQINARQNTVAAKSAWCNFNGTSTGTNAPTAGGNVTSVTRNGLGDYTVNFTAAFASANYAACVTVKGDGGAPEGFDITSQSVSAFRFITRDITGLNIDCPIVNVIVFGD